LTAKGRTLLGEADKGTEKKSAEQPPRQRPRWALVVGRWLLVVGRSFFSFQFSFQLFCFRVAPPPIFSTPLLVAFIIQKIVSHARWIVHASLYAVTLGLRFGQRLYYLSTVATCASSQTMQSFCIRTQMAKEFVG